METERFQFSCVPYIAGKPMKCNLHNVQHFWATERQAKEFAVGIAYGIHLYRHNVFIATYKNVGETCDVYRLFDTFSMGKRPEDLPVVLGRPEICMYGPRLVRLYKNQIVTCKSEMKKGGFECVPVNDMWVVDDLYFYELDDEQLVEHIENTKTRE